MTEEDREVATDTTPLDLLQTFFPLGIFNPVADNGSILPDVVLECLKEQVPHVFDPQSDRLLVGIIVNTTQHVKLKCMKKRVSPYLPLPQFVVIQLLFISDLLFWRRRQKFELSFFGLPQQLLSSNLNLCGSFVLHLEQFLSQFIIDIRGKSQA